jgi:uncharacterized protein (TIGR00297 family)
MVARAMRAVSDGGALLGALAAFVLMSAAGLAGSMPLLTLFLLTIFTTRWGRRRKERLGVAERRHGRTAAQIIANLGAATLCALPAIWMPRASEILLAGSIASLAEAAADTTSSEFGQASAAGAFLITDFREVPIGTNGAVSVAGTLIGCLASALVAWVAGFFEIVSWRWFPVIAIAGIAGMLFDSVLGATLENRGRLGNDAVNFVSTIFAADLALIVIMISLRVAS